MRLKDGPDLTLRKALACRVQRRYDFRRVMCVIVDNRHPPSFTLDFEPSSSTMKFGQRVPCHAKFDAQVIADRQARQGVADIVVAGQPGSHQADRFRPTQRQKITPSSRVSSNIFCM